MKPLGCDPRRIKGVSEKLIVSHYENNYGGAMKRLNLISEQLAGLDFNIAPNFLVNGLKREELIATNSMILHELFFDGLGDDGQPGRELAVAIARDFRSFERWRAEFLAMGKALGGGSGWVLLSYSPRDGKLVNQWAADHCHTLAGGQPILALDMYEHSYHIDYGAKATWPSLARANGSSAVANCAWMTARRSPIAERCGCRGARSSSVEQRSRVFLPRQQKRG
jgi:Fe-Mn family superoxide dismutase